MEQNAKRARRLAQGRQLAKWLEAAVVLVVVALLAMLLLTHFMG